MITRWKKERHVLKMAKKMRRAFRSGKPSWPQLEHVLKQWILNQETSKIKFEKKIVWVTTVSVRLQAIRIATEMELNNFKGGFLGIVLKTNEKGWRNGKVMEE